RAPWTWETERRRETPLASRKPPAARRTTASKLFGRLDSDESAAPSKALPSIGVARRRRSWRDAPGGLMHPSSNRVPIGSPFGLAAFLGSMFAVRVVAASEPIGAIEADRARIQRHLADVERELRARDVSDMPEDPRRARAANLDRLHEYWVKGVFPHNDSFVGRRVPFFIDAEGRACAVAYLPLESGGTEAAHDVAAGMNNARVHDMTSPALAQWLARSGLTLEEAARIQPDYCACPDIESPVCGGDGNTYYNECVARVCGGLTVSCCDACPGNPTPVSIHDCGLCPDVSNCVGCDCPLGATTTIECPTSTTSTTSESTTTTS